MPYIPYNQIKILKEIARGGYGIVYQAIWFRNGKEHLVAAKKFLKSRDLGYFLNELESYRKCCHCGCIIEYYGFTVDPKAKDFDFMLILNFAQGGNLHDYLRKNFMEITWKEKVEILSQISIGLSNIHNTNFIHKDLHSGNILKVLSNKQCCKANHQQRKQWKIGDLGLSQPADIPSLNDDIYGIIPYIAPEIFEYSKYSKASDVYSFGMIMWELITGRRPFWDLEQDEEVMLIVQIVCAGKRPQIIANAPKGYVKLMEECWSYDPGNRPTAADVHERIKKIFEHESSNPTKIMESPDIGPVKMNPNNICKSRSLSDTIRSAMSLRNSKGRSESDPIFYCQKNRTAFNGKRKFADNLIEDNNGNVKHIKRKKLFENENDDYVSRELELDICESHQPNNNGT